MVHIDHFYGYFINFPFILISAMGRELSRNFFTLRFVRKKYNLISCFNSKYNLSHKRS